MSKKPLALIILDGYGYSPESYGNAIAAAATPNLDKLFESCPHTTIGASGMDVGLPDGQMGNSEVGHTNIGVITSYSIHYTKLYELQRLLLLTYP